MSLAAADAASPARPAPASAFCAQAREALLEQHPLLLRDYTIPTPAVREAVDIARERVWMRRPAVVFYAKPRVGKTRCAFATCAALSEEFRALHLTHVTLEGTPRPSHKHLYRMLLGAESHALRGHDASQLLDRLTAHITLRVRDRGGAQYVLVLDEMQLLDEVDYAQLVVLHNRLEHFRIRMTTIGFAQPEILQRRSALAATRNQQIIARFLAEVVPFRGCASAQALAAILETFDAGSEFPEGSGLSYTHFFVPLAFAAGFRLAYDSTRLWQALTGQGAATGAAASAGELRMERVCFFIETLLLRLRQQDVGTLAIADDDIAEALALGAGNDADAT